MAHDPNLANLVLYYTGGGSNATPSASIGGAISSVRIPSQSATGTPPTGVTIDNALGNEQGDGTLTVVVSGANKSITWQPFRGSPGTSVPITESGVWFVKSAVDGGLCLTIDYNSLPSSTTGATITIANQTEKFFSTTTKAQSKTGLVRYHCFAVKNTHATLPVDDVRGYIAENTPGVDNCLLYLDPLAASNGATGPTAVANDTTEPAGAAWVNPTAFDHADKLAFGLLNAGQVRFFWVKQTTPANVGTPEPNNTFIPGFYMIS